MSTEEPRFISYGKYKTLEQELGQARRELAEQVSRAQEAEAKCDDFGRALAEKIQELQTAKESARASIDALSMSIRDLLAANDTANKQLIAALEKP